MNPKQKPKLLQEMESRAKWYYRGFWNLVQEGCEHLLSYEETKRRSTKEASQRKLRRAQELYNSIPLEKLTDSPDHDIFLATKSRLEQLIITAKRVYQGEKSEIIKPLPQEIFELGQEYRGRLKSLERKIQNKLKSYKTWNYSRTDINGKEWKILF